MKTAKEIWIMTSIVLWIVAILLPLYILPVCSPDLFSAFESSMKSHICTKTLYANTIISITGLLLSLASIRETFFRIASYTTTLLALFIILFPIAITGVCSVSTMSCVWGTKPGLIITGALLIMSGIAGIIIAEKSA